MTLTDERRKALTEYLGEPEATSEYTVANSGDLVSVRTVIQNRTFDTDADMMALFRNMVDRKIWDRFSIDLARTYREDHPLVDWYNAAFIAWLFYDSERFCCLVAEWLEVKK